MMIVNVKLMNKLMNLNIYLQKSCTKEKENTKVSFLSFVLTIMKLVIFLLGALIRRIEKRSMETSTRA